MTHGPLARVLLASLVAGTSLARPTLAGVIFSYDFEKAKAWPDAACDVQPSTPLPVEPSVEVAKVGTIDKAGTSDAGGGLLLIADVGDAKSPWEAIFTSGLLPVKNAEADLAKLTLSFDCSVSIARPITVRFESFDASKRRTGGLETVIYPPAADFYQRSAIDLSTMKKEGDGAFKPTDPFVQITFVASGPAFPSGAKHAIRVDNVCYASPAYYVSPKGAEKNDGLTEKTPFLYPQQAVDLAKPGDIILLMDGEYRRGGGNGDQDGIIHIECAGTPAAWIVVKNYPGQSPVLRNEDAWNAIRVGGPVRTQAFKDVPPAYLEFRGLHVRGGADEVMQKHRADIGLAKATTNGNGISGGGVKGGVPAHHLRVADCISEYNPGAGIGFGSSDWVTLENNTSFYNCWFTIYATSGMGTIGTDNFDAADNVYKTLLRNNRVSWNRTYVEWKQIGKMSDGNGIIMDVNNDPAKHQSYLGRTLVQNNVVTYNGGSGIHAFKAHRIDIVNNTAYFNAATPELGWGQIFLNRVEDAHVLNNVMWARPGQPVNTVSTDITDRGNPKAVRADNVYFGGGYPPIMGTDDVVADPKFVDVTKTTWQAPLMDNFRLKSDSPAIGKGKWTPLTPLTDIDGHPRSLTSPPDAGAFQSR